MRLYVDGTISAGRCKYDRRYSVPWLVRYLEGGRNKELEIASLWTVPGESHIKCPDFNYSPVEVAPGELFLDEATGLERLHGLDDVQVGDVLQLGVLGGIGVLLGHHDSLLEEELIDGDTMRLGHKHPVAGREENTRKG